MHSTPKTKRYNCDICNYNFSHSDQEQKHLKEQHPDELIVCQHGCDKVFSSEEKMKRHVVCRNRSRIFSDNIGCTNKIILHSKENNNNKREPLKSTKCTFRLTSDVAVF